MTDDRIFELNVDKLRKHFRTYCAEMGMEYTQWVGNIFTTPQCMMEGESPKRLTAEFINPNTNKVLMFSLGMYDRRYEIREVK